MSSQIAYPYGRKMMQPRTDEYEQSSAPRQMSVYQRAKSSSRGVIDSTNFSILLKVVSPDKDIPTII
jgi:hypothetical protein